MDTSSIDSIDRKPDMRLRLLNAASFLGVMAVNYTAGKNIGDISDKYPTELTPAGYAFAIWAMIYLGLFAFVFYQIFLTTDMSCRIVKEIGYLFVISNFLNAGWIFLFTTNTPTSIGFSCLFILSLLACNFYIQSKSNSWKEKNQHTLADIIITDVTFSFYNGWVTVASIVNITIFLKSIGVDAEKQTACVWAAVMVVVAALINLMIIVRQKDPVIPLVYIWAVLAIRHSHISDGDSDDNDKMVGWVIICCVIVVAIAQCILIKHLISSRDQVRKAQGLSISSFLISSNNA